MNRSNPDGDDRSKTGSGFLQLDLGSGPGGRTDRLTAELRAAVLDGRLPAGSALPASRTLAGELGVSRGVVTQAYQRLTQDGLVAGRGRAGTVVLDTRAARAGLPEQSRQPPQFVAAPDVEAFEGFRTAPSTVDLSPGSPDLSAFPRVAWLRAERAVLQELSPTDLGYGNAAGAAPARAAIAGWLGRYRGIGIGPDRIVVTSGVAQALALLARVLHRQGIDTIAVEDPGSLGARQQLQNWGMTTTPVPVDDLGIRVDRLAATGARAVLLTPAHQFPTGVVLDPGRRRDLLEWAAGGGLVIEDDYDAEHRYDRAPVAALASLLPEQTCYAGSVSKTLAPALRMGWLVVPERLQASVVAAKRDADLGSSVLGQLALARLMGSGELERHLRAVGRRHRRRRDAMIGALHRYLPEARIHGAAAGLHVTVTLDPGVDDIMWARAAFEEGVKVTPLSWHRLRPGRPGLVLGYAAVSEGEIDTAIAVLGRLLTSPH